MVDDFYLSCSLDDDRRIKLKESLHLHGKWEMALIEMVYELSDRIELEKTASYDDTWRMTCFFQLGTDKVDFDDVNLRRKFGNEYTTNWNLAADKHDRYVFIDSLTKELSKAKQQFTMREIVSLLNAGIKEKTDDIKNYIQSVGLSYEGVPEFLIVDSKIKITFPKYVKRVCLGKNLCSLLGFVEYVEEYNGTMNDVYYRDVRWTPCPYVGEHLGKPLSYFEFKAVERTTDVVADEDFQINAKGKNMFIYCSLLDYRVVGSISTPLLRFTPLKVAKHTINLVEFENVFYYSLLYNDINEFNIDVLNELGIPIRFYKTKPTFLLHFRRKHV